jgi:NTE family protein
MARGTPTTQRLTDSRRRSVARPAIGLVLSGGGARGYAHIGMLRVLERHGVEPDVMAGTSMGAILAALYAHGYRADDLYDMAAAIPWRNELEMSLVAGVLKSDKLEELLRSYLPATFEELGKPLAVTCTDLEAGEALVFTEGELIPAIRASACYPGAFEPIAHAGRTLVDGGILNNLPVDALALMRARLTLASDVSPPRRATYADAGEGRHSWWQRMVATVTPERRAPLSAVSLRAADIMMRLLTDAQYVHHPADLRVLHDMPDVRVDSFGALDEAVAHGEVNTEAALRANPDLLARLQAASGPPMRRRPPPRPDLPAADAVVGDAPRSAARDGGVDGQVGIRERRAGAGGGVDLGGADESGDLLGDSGAIAAEAVGMGGDGREAAVATHPTHAYVRRGPSPGRRAGDSVGEAASPGVDEPAQEEATRDEHPVLALWSHLRRG